MVQVLLFHSESLILSIDSNNHNVNILKKKERKVTRKGVNCEQFCLEPHLSRTITQSEGLLFRNLIMNKLYHFRMHGWKITCNHYDYEPNYYEDTLIIYILQNNTNLLIKVAIILGKT